MEQYTSYIYRMPLRKKYFPIVCFRERSTEPPKEGLVEVPPKIVVDPKQSNMISVI
jgi:hypothetical protein